MCLNSFKIMYLKEVPDKNKKNLDYKNKFSSVAPLKTFLPGIQCNEFKGNFFPCYFLRPKQDPDSKYFRVKGKQQSKASCSSCSVQLPFDVPPSPYTKDGM